MHYLNFASAKNPGGFIGRGLVPERKAFFQQALQDTGRVHEEYYRKQPERAVRVIYGPSILRWCSSGTGWLWEKPFTLNGLFTSPLGYGPES